MINDEKVFTETDIGTYVTVTTAEGTFIEQKVVSTFCLICGEIMIGTMAAAGGFLARHEHFHQREVQLAEIHNQA
jgi:hypothetical protein